MKNAFKNPMFLLGFLYIFGLVVISFVYSAAVHNKVHQVLYLLDKNRHMVAVAPISPRWSLPLGTDRMGFDMLSKILLGAKYTILGAIIIGLIRMVIAVPIGMFLGVYLKRYKKYVNGIVDSFHFIPLTVIAFYILYPVLWEPKSGFHTSLWERMSMEVIILALLTVPVIAVVIGNETGRIIENEYVVCARTLGAGKWRVIIKHIVPGLKEKIFVLLGQQTMQALIVLAHLGYLELFFGGTRVKYGFDVDPPTSITNEWSGLIGNTFRYLHIAAWVPLSPIVCFAISMIAISFMVEGYVQATAGHSHYFKKKKGDARKKEVSVKPEEDSFVLQKEIS
jgi:peptide/nickel transport system permease protein